MLLNNIFEGVSFDKETEQITTLIENEKLRIEKIVTSGQNSPEGFWYDQDEDEFVIVLQGSATVDFEDRSCRLASGDYLFIKAHEKHRVSWSDPEVITLWLAVFVK